MYEEIHKLAEQIYDKGYKKGCKDTQEAMAGKRAYQQGLKDAWEYARNTPIGKLCGKSFEEFMHSITAAEDADRLRRYEEEQK